MKIVICTNKNGWQYVKKNFWGKEEVIKDSYGPDYGEICTVVSERDGYYEILEYENTYTKYCFSDITDEEVKDILEKRKREILLSVGQNVQVSDTTKV